MTTPPTPDTAPAHCAAPACALQPPLTEAEVLGAVQRAHVGHGGLGPSRLLRLLAEPDLSPQTMVTHIGAEPSVAIRVLRTANSPFYGQSGQVSTLTRAAQVLGQDALRGIALAACFDGLSTRDRGLVHPDMQAFRRHSVATACAAQELAQAAAPHLYEQAFVAGLLHDLGLLLLWRLRPATLSCAACRSGLACRPAGLGHADCGRLMLQAWSMPASLVQAVAGHDDLSADEPPIQGGPAPEPTLGRVLSLAEALACSAGYTLASDTIAELPLPGEPLFDACAGAACTFPASAERLFEILSH